MAKQRNDKCIPFCIPYEAYFMLKRVAEQRGLNISALVREVVLRFLAEQPDLRGKVEYVAGCPSCQLVLRGADHSEVREALRKHIVEAHELVPSKALLDALIEISVSPSSPGEAGSGEAGLG